MAHLQKTGKEHPAHSDVQLAQFVTEELIELAVLRSLVAGMPERARPTRDGVPFLSDQDAASVLDDLSQAIGDRIAELEDAHG